MSESKGPLFNGQDFDTWWDAIEDEHNWDEFSQTSLARLVWDHCAASRDAEIERLRAEVYHTAPGELEFGGEGWTWKQQARANEDRLRELEAEVARLGGVVAAAVQAEQAARERVKLLEAALRGCLAVAEAGMSYIDKELGGTRMKDSVALIEARAALNPPAKEPTNG